MDAINPSINIVSKVTQQERIDKQKVSCEQ